MIITFLKIDKEREFILIFNNNNNNNNNMGKNIKKPPKLPAVYNIAYNIQKVIK